MVSNSAEGRAERGGLGGAGGVRMANFSMDRCGDVFF